VKRAAIAVALVVLAASAVVAARALRPGPPPPAGVDAAYATVIQPIFDRRCVACHAGDHAPCDLDLTSFAALDRGARQSPSGPRFPVVAREAPHDLAQSILHRFLIQRREYPASHEHDAEPPVCPRTLRELEHLVHDLPDRGCPRALPAVPREEEDAIAQWIERGAGGPPQ
jgi:hypothetical protein